MKTFTDDEITRELNCYPVAAGINKGGDIMRQLKRERDALRARLERAEEDSKLIDFLESNIAAVGWRISIQEGRVIFTRPDLKQHPTLRAAIRFAMSSAKPGEKEGT